MSRSPIAVVALLVASVSPVAAQTVTPVSFHSPHPANHGASPKPGHTPAAKHTPAFSNAVKIPSGPSHVAAADCGRRTVGVNTSRNAMGPGPTSKSQTLVAVPIGGGSVKSATTQAQIDEACGKSH